MNLPCDLGAQIKANIGTNPKAASSEVINGDAIDRLGFNGALLVLQVGSATGTPTTKSAAAKLQESTDGSTNWGDVSGAAISAITTNNQISHKSVSLKGCKRYVRAVTTVALTEGTTPALPVSATILLGGSDSEPVA